MSQIILDSANDLIQGDFDNATLSQRTRLQTSTVNATTGIYVIPNGSATSASVQISNNSNVTNASKLVVATNASTDTQIISGANGSGSYLPLSFYTNNDIRFQMGNAGELNVRTAPGTVSSGTSGQFLTSGGPGAGVSWTTVTIPPSGQLTTQIFTSPGTWTRPSSATTVKVWVAGSGGGSPNTQPGGGPWPGQGGNGGFAVAANVPVSAPVAVTVGAGGTTPGPGGQSGGNSGNSSSFGALVSATGGAGGPNSPGGIGANGTGTVSAGTAIYTGACTFGTTLGGATVFPTSKQSFAPRAGLAWSSASNVAPFYGSGGLSPGSVGEGYGGIGGVVIVEFVG